MENTTNPFFDPVEITEEQQEQINNLKATVTELQDNEDQVFEYKDAVESLLDYYFQINQHRLALPLLLELKEKQEELDFDIIEQATLLRRLGLVHYSNKEFEEANACFDKGLLLLEDVENQEVTGKILTNLGNVAATQEDYETAIEYYEQAIAADEENEIDAPIPYFNLGLAYLQLGDLQEAADCFEDALEIYKESEEDTQEAELNLHKQLGSIYSQLQNWDDSLKHWYKVSLVQKENADEELGQTYGVMSHLLIRMDEFKKGIEFGEKTIEELLKTGDIEEKTDWYFQVGTWYQHYFEDWTSAKSNYEAALNMVEQEAEEGEWKTLLIEKLHDSIEIMQSKIEQQLSKKSGLFGRLFGK